MTARTNEELWRDLFMTALGVCLQADQDAINKFEAMVASAEAGDPVAQRTLRHPWLTSEDPGKKIKALKKSLADNQAKLGDLLGETLPVMLSVGRSASLLRDFENAQSAKVVSSEAIDRLRDKLKKAGATDSLIERASYETMQHAVAMMRERALPASASSQLRLQTLERLELVGLISHTGSVPINKALARAASEGHAGAAEIIPMEENVTAIWPVIPITLNAARFPAGYEDWRVKSMVPALWDGIGDTAFYEVIARALDKEKPVRWKGDDEYLPAYLTYDEMYKHEAEFREHHLDAEEEVHLLSSYRELLTSEDLDKDTTISKQARAEVLDYCFHNEELYLDRTAWDVWTHWRVMFEAIKRFIEDTYPGPVDDDVVRIWLYLLEGRLASSEAKLPALHRRLLFDWLELPVTFSKAPATRYLVPVCVLQAGGPDDPILQPHSEVWQQRFARLGLRSELRMRNAEETHLRKLVNRRLSVIVEGEAWEGSVEVPWQEISGLCRNHREVLAKLYVQDHQEQSGSSQFGASKQPSNILSATDREGASPSQEDPVIPATAVIAETEEIFLKKIDELLLTAVTASKSAAIAETPVSQSIAASAQTTEVHPQSEQPDLP